jgi:hypothetical protein
MRSRRNVRVCRVLNENHVVQIHKRRILLERPPVILGILLKHILKK